MTLDDIKIMRTWIDNISVIPPNHEGSAAAIVAQQIVKKEWSDLIDLAESALMWDALVEEFASDHDFEWCRVAGHEHGTRKRLDGDVVLWWRRGEATGKTASDAIRRAYADWKEKTP
ncbi:MAG TPA: hypothetical protein VFH61_14135 [Thermoleophilia bacterium]|nr:hypothetical protein [Thermoleophilia bacterium]